MLFLWLAFMVKYAHRKKMTKAKTKKKKTHTLIISDLHLGSLVSQPQKALEIIQSYSFRKLILLGDVFENLDFRNLSRESWELLAYIGKISQTRKVRWVIGNHDKGLQDVFNSLMNATIYDTYSWQYKQEKYLAIHGHQFDRFLVDNAFISYVANKIYDFIQRFDFEDKRVSHFLKRKSKGWLRLSEKVANLAIIYGKKNAAKYVFCGHTHKAMKKSKQGVRYYNSGCWTDTPCSYITINEKEIEVINR
jgi:UDP-2,3-diacylglucosamine pyrophosphatase LpxH